MGYRKGYYKKNGTYVQGHYTNTGSRSFSNKNNNGCVVLFLVLLLLGFPISCSNSSSSDTASDTATGTNCPSKTCGDFTSRSQAQSTYDSNRSCYKKLDADGDGIACENLSK